MYIKTEEKEFFINLLFTYEHELDHIRKKGEWNQKIHDRCNKLYRLQDVIREKISIYIGEDKCQ